MTWIPVETAIACPTCKADRWTICHNDRYRSCPRRVSEYRVLLDLSVTITNDRSQSGPRDRHE